MSKKRNSKLNSFPDYPKTKIRVIGIGGGGGSIVSEIGSQLKKATFIIADTDSRFLNKSKKKGIKNFHFGKGLTQGLGTGMDSELAKTAAEKEKNRIAKIFKGQDISIIIASLGGGVGSGAAPVFSKIANECGNITLGIFTLPFNFEGKKKTKLANSSLDSLKSSFNSLIIIPNQRIFKIITEKTSIIEALSIINDNLVESLESLVDMIYKPGVINIDFADICTVLKDKNKLAFLNTVETKEKEGADGIADKIFNNQLYDYNLNAEKILFNVVGGNDLKMSDVEKISESISKSNPKAKIIFGISREPKYKNKIKTTLLITGNKDIPVQEKKKPNKKNKLVIKKKQKIKIKPVKKRRTALDIKKAEQKKEKEKLTEEKSWEIPAFLRRSGKG